MTRKPKPSPDRSAPQSAKVVATKSDIASVRADMETLELRMTLELYAAVAAGVGLVKVFDFLIG